MKKGYVLLFLLYIAAMSIILSGCGSGAGAPGSKGTEDTGVILEGQIVGLYLDLNTDDVDAFQADCDPDPATVEPEEFTAHQAEVTFTASLINQNPTIKPGTLYIDKYTVEYKRSNDSLGAPPIEKDTRFQSITIVPPLSGPNMTITETRVMLVDLPRKDQYYDDVVSGRYSYHPAYINNYTAIYTFYGKNDYGENFTLKAQMDFQIGAYDYCD